MEHSKEYIESINISIDELGGKILSKISVLNLVFDFSYRIKKEDKITKKLKFRGFTSVLQLNDIYGFRIITRNRGDAYCIYNHILSKLEVKTKSDLFKSPITLTNKGFEGKKFKMLRIVATYNKCPYEIQITTKRFHKINEAHHKSYFIKKYD